MRMHTSVGDEMVLSQISLLKKSGFNWSQEASLSTIVWRHWDNEITSIRRCLIVCLYLLLVVLPTSSRADALNVTGSNYYGQLGEETMTASSTPVLLGTDVSQAAAGEEVRRDLELL